MNKQNGVFKNLYKNLLTPILKKDSGIDAEYLTNLSLSLLSFSSRKYNWPIVSSILKNLNDYIDKIIEDKKSGEYRLSHHLDLKTGFYKGRQVLDPKE